MANYDLGTARGRIDIDASGAKRGAAEGKDAANSLESGTKSVGASAASAGLALTGLGAIAIGAFAAAVKASADFEKSLSEFKAVTGATTEQLDQIREKALQLGADTAFSAKEAADAMVELGKQGLSTSQILDGAADATVALAAAGGIELPEAAGIAAAALNEFKLQAQDLPHVADLLAGAANASATGVSELGQAMSFVGPVAQAMGLSIDDSVTALALLANNGIDASRGGTALRAILSRLAPTSKKAAGELRELGIITANGSNAFFDAQGNVKSMAEIVGILNDHTKDLTAQQKIQALQTIFGTEALAAANVMAGTTAKSFEELQLSIEKTSATDVAAERMNNLSGAMEELQGSIETVLIKAGSQFQTGITGIVKALTSFVNLLGNLNPQIQKWIGFLLAGGGAALILVGGILLLVSAVEKFKEAWAAVNIVMAANPIIRVVIIIAALVAAVIAAYKNIQVFHDFVDRLWDDFQPIWEGIKTTVIAAASAIKDWIQGTLIPIFLQWRDTIIEVAATVRDWLGSKLGAVWEGIKTGAGGVLSWLTGVFNPGMKGAWDEAQKNGASLGDWFKITFGPILSQVGSQIKTSLVGLLGWFGTDFIPGIKDFWVNQVQPAWQAYVDWVNSSFVPALQTAATNVQTAVGTMATAINNFVTNQGQTDFFSGLTEKISGAWNTAIEFLNVSVLPRIQGFIVLVQEQFGLFLGWIQANFGPVLTALLELWGAIWNAMGPIVQGALGLMQIAIGVFIGVITVLWNVFGQGLIQIFQSIWLTMKGIVEGALQIITGIINIFTALISGDWGKLWEGIVNIASGAWRIITALISGAIGVIIGILTVFQSVISAVVGAAWNFVISKTREIWNSAIDAVKGAIGTIVGAVQGLASSISGAMHVDLFGAGKAIMDSLLSGLKSAFESVKNFIGGVASWIAEHKGPPAKDAKLLVDNGELIMEGFAKGIMNGWNQIKGTIGDVTSGIPGAAATTIGGNTNSVVINLSATGSNGQAIADGIANSGVLRKITQAVKAGSL
jgi:TP901 family phage tail tape measure protein